jgi:uncharacterized coiled-coil DUF342 family protein
MNLPSWSEHALITINSVATVIGIAAAALALLSIGIIYLTNTELGARIKTKADAMKPATPILFGNGDRSNGNKTSITPSSLDPARLSELQTELASARKAEASKGSRLAEVDAELTKARQAGETTAARVAQLQSELTSVHQSEEGKAARLAEIEKKLADAQRSDETRATRIAELEKKFSETQRSDEAKAARVAELEKELVLARRSVEQANAQTKEVELKQGPRRLTPEQRTQFLAAARGLPTGKVIVSAFFDNQETHEFGAEILNLLKEAGFDVVERAPVNFFTTSRPSSGIRIGCQDMNNPPAHLASVRKVLAAVGLEAPDTTVVNADEPDVVEIQITPRQ